MESGKWKGIPLAEDPECAECGESVSDDFPVYVCDCGQPFCTQHLIEHKLRELQRKAAAS